MFWHSLGFLIILVLAWCDSIFDLVHWLVGYPSLRPDELPETIIKLSVIILLWLFSGMKLYKIVSRLNYLENFLHVCAWCRKIEYGSRWLTLEDHFLQQTGHQATHGICPDCARKLRREEVTVPAE
jgi:hypothetical protein